jgi:hypothetical protein
VYFYIAQFISLLVKFEFQMPVNMQAVIEAVIDTVELNALPKEDIIESIKESPAV